jgi:hypothetical protein
MPSLKQYRFACEEASNLDLLLSECVFYVPIGKLASDTFTNKGLHLVTFHVASSCARSPKVNVVHD